MKTTVKLVHRWLPPFLLLNSLALLALAVLALMQIKSEEPLLVKIRHLSWGKRPEGTEGTGSFTNLLAYKKVRMHFLDVYMTLAASITTAVLACMMLSSTHWVRLGVRWLDGAQRKNNHRKRIEHVATFLVDCALLLVALVLFCVVLSVYNEAEHAIDMSNPLLPDHHVDRWIAYGPIAKNQWFTFETWNCALAPIIPWDNGSYPSTAFLAGRCHQLQAMRFLILPLLAVASVRAAISSQLYRESAEAPGRHLVDEASDPLLQPEAAELESSRRLLKRLRSTQYTTEAPAHPPPEMVGSNATMVELPGSGIQELPGNDGTLELDAGHVAKELEGD